jgi:hypothetical protein
MIAWVLRNPFASLAVPPTLILLQFLDLLLLLEVGLPESMPETQGLPGLLLGALAALSLLSVPAMLLAVRQVFMLPNKIAPSLGLVANGVYLVGFLVFFALAFMVRTFN